MKNTFNRNLLILILFIAAALRFYIIGSYGITADELSALQRTEYNNFSEMITGGVLVDFHPPLVQIFMFYWAKLFGTTEFVTRLPFAILGIFSIYFYYRIAEKWFNKNTAILATAAIACNQLLIIYSRLARPYAFGMFFTAAAFWYLTKIIHNKNYSIKNITLYIFCALCAMNTHYFSLVFIALIGMCSLFFITKENAKFLLLSGLIMCIMYVPTLPILKHQLDAGGIGADSGGWLGLPDFQFIINYFKYLVNNSRYILLLFVIIIGFLVKHILNLKKQFKNTEASNLINNSISIKKSRLIIITLWLFPVVFGYIYSYANSPILQHSVLTFSTPYFFILLFSFLPSSVSKKAVTIAVLSIIIGVTSITVFAKNFYNTNYFGVYKPIANRTLEWEIKYGKHNITHTINTDNAFFIDYYYKQWNRPVDYKIYNLASRDSLKSMVNIVENSYTEYFSFAWTNIANHWEILEIIKSKYPLLIDKKYFFNSEYYLFKKNNELVEDKDCVFEFNCNFDASTKKMNGNEQTNVAGVGTNNSTAVLLDDKSEFSPGFEMNATELFKNENNILNISATVKNLEPNAEAEMVVVLNNKDSATSWQAMNTKCFAKDTINWYKAYFSLRFPKNSNIDDVVKIYFWNSSKKKMIIDDVVIKTTVGNPIIYGDKNDF